jgi:hypothetical protein
MPLRASLLRRTEDATSPRAAAAPGQHRAVLAATVIAMRITAASAASPMDTTMLAVSVSQFTNA